jgi:ABC-2 type transport system permease protein
LFAVAAREVRWIRRDPVARFLLFGVPVVAFALLGFTFSNAVIRGLDVVVVDMDNSATSRLFVQTLAAAPGISVATRADDLGAAASAIRAGRAIAAAYLPPEFGKDVLAGRAPRAVSFTNTQFFTPGSNAGKSINDGMWWSRSQRGLRSARSSGGEACAPGGTSQATTSPAPWSTSCCRTTSSTC